MDDLEKIDPWSFGEGNASDLNPEYCKGPLRHVMTATNLPEAELLTGLLKTVGIPSIIKRISGVLVADFAQTGGLDIYVPESGLAAAREVLQLPALPAPAAPAVRSPLNLGLSVLAGFAVLVIVAALLGTR